MNDVVYYRQDPIISELKLNITNSASEWARGQNMTEETLEYVFKAVSLRGEGLSGFLDIPKSRPRDELNLIIVLA